MCTQEPSYKNWRKMRTWTKYDRKLIYFFLTKTDEFAEKWQDEGKGLMLLLAVN